MARVGDAYRPSFTPPQKLAITEILALVRDLRLPEAAIVLQVACSAAQLDELARKLQAEDAELSLPEMHVVLAALAVAPLAFPASEEAFHTRIGFFRENVAELARSLISAVARLHDDHPAAAAQ